MDRFLKCLCRQDYSALIISGKPTEEELLSAWYMIISEYTALKNIDITENRQWAISRELIRLHSHLQILQLCINFLTVRYSDAVAHSLRRLGYRFKPTSTNPKEYIHLLHEVAEISKTKYIQIQQYNKELKKIVDEKKIETPTEKSFDNMLIAIEEMQHVAYSFDTLTVSKFVALDLRYREHINTLESRKIKANGY
jgi:hypothetical protein